MPQALAPQGSTAASAAKESFDAPGLSLVSQVF